MSPIKMKRLESGIRLAVELLGNINNHKIEGIAGLLSDDCVLESSSPAPDGVAHSGKERIGRYYEVLFAERPGLSCKIEEMAGFGHRCVARWRSSWKDAEGREKTVREIVIMREKNDVLCEILCYSKSAVSDCAPLAQKGDCRS